MQKSAVFFFIW